MKRNIKFAFFFGVIAILSYVVSIPYMIAISDHVLEQLNEMADTRVTTVQYIFGSGINLIITAFIFSLVGIFLSSKAGLRWDWIRSVFEKAEKPRWDYKYLWISIGWGFISAVVISVLISFVFAPNIPSFLEVNQTVDIPWWVGLTTIFQGGISEELIMRFGLMTLLVWILSKVFMRKKSVISPWIYWIAIVGTSLVFGIGHLPLAQLVYGELTLWVVLYILIGNGFAGLGFGFLYWKRGLEYAIVSHMSADFMLHFVTPLI
ncbi:CPBP family intramembrane glutamic endopeptidase [Aquibacillus albus]|uniref:Membrane protease YdiL (CAAX protease family) n=1 Tax=Aquibacillus albus TaxID=1168171 RepID=A0ABS2N6E5_9BACI|nr:CPBP family intramembrane glutamic endopeptidase [Aquibacillus albus]MBM7573678.1 membrane protease YdiL (CAAX protease family) [Aquibacillus albus]